jgi:hypothetical protein
MARFTAIPGVPQTNITDEQSLLISTIKQNVELLAGIRGEEVSAKGEGFTISGQNVVSLEDYDKLRQDVQTLADDLAFTRAVLNALITQLKG